MVRSVAIAPIQSVPAVPRRVHADPPAPAWAYPALCAASVVLYWLPRLNRGFWTDETGSFWAAHHGWAHLWPTFSVLPTQSIFYAYVSALFASDGLYKEPLLRLPSLVGMSLAAWLLFKLTRDIVGREAAWAAVVPFACCGAIVETAVNARPYALGLAVVMASFYSLRTWTHTQTRRSFWAYCAFSASVAYFHYLFAMIFPVQALYLVAARSAGRRFAWKRALFAALLITAAAVPLAAPIMMLGRASTRWTTAATPGALEFLELYPLHACLTVALGLMLFFILHREWFPAFRGLPFDDAVLLASWMLFGPLSLFILARSASFAMFATRYVIYALPPAFILLAWCISQVRNQRAVFALAAAIAVSAALYVPHMQTPPEWRTPIAEAQAAAGPSAPLLIRSGFVESAVLDWRSEPRPDTHLFAPLIAYPVRNEVIPVPFFVNDDAERYLEKQIESREYAAGRFGLLAETGSDVLRRLPRWFAARGYAASVRQSGGFEIVVFTRAPR